MGVLEQLQQYLSRIPVDDVFRWNFEAVKVIKTAYVLGYGQTPWSQRLLVEWRNKSRKTVLATAKPQVRVPRASSGVQQPSTVDNPSGGTRSLETFPYSKLRVLNLPQLLAYDLETNIVDQNVLELLYISSTDLIRMRETVADRLLEREIQELARTPDQRLKGLQEALRRTNRKLDETGWLRISALACLTISRLQYEHIDDIESSAATIRQWMVRYASHWAQYLARDPNLRDAANDYYLVAISLNTALEQRNDSLTLMLLKNSLGFKHNTPLATPEDLIKIRPSEQWHDHEIQALARSLLEYGNHDNREAEQLFARLPQYVQTRVLDLLGEIFALEHVSFYNCIGAYTQLLNRLLSLLVDMAKCSSSDRIVSSGQELRSRISDMRFLVSRRNKDIAGMLIEGAREIEHFIQATGYDTQYRALNAAKHVLARVEACKESDNRTNLWATNYLPTSRQWCHVLDDEFAAVVSRITPNIAVSLPEECVTLTEDEEPRAIFRIENAGTGPADNVRLRIVPADDNWEVGRLSQGRQTRINGQDAVEGYFTIKGKGNSDAPVDAAISFRYDISYHNLNGDLIPKLEPDSRQSPLTLAPLPPKDSIVMSNPFCAGPEVRDERMFVGRKQMLEEVSKSALGDTGTGLLMLHGQKRVGKSSLLHFIEQRINAEHDGGVMAVSVSWENMSAHDVNRVIKTLLDKIKRKTYSLFNYQLQSPSLVLQR